MNNSNNTWNHPEFVFRSWYNIEGTIQSCSIDPQAPAPAPRGKFQCKLCPEKARVLSRDCYRAFVRCAFRHYARRVIHRSQVSAKNSDVQEPFTENISAFQYGDFTSLSKQHLLISNYHQVYDGSDRVFQEARNCSIRRRYHRAWTSQSLPAMSSSDHLALTQSS